MLRYSKSEVGIKSVRVRAWEPGRKLLALAYAFLVRLLANFPPDTIAAILRWAHRTGRQARTLYLPIYRLRSALSNLWA